MILIAVNLKHNYMYTLQHIGRLDTGIDAMFV